MARSLAKIHEQIAKLQREANSIESGVIARIKREIAQHGLTVEHLFGTSAGSSSNSSTGSGAGKAVKVAPAKKATSGKPAKFADDQGNTWGGMGKRPQWLHAALEAGHSIEEFLVTAKKPAANAKPAAKAKAKSKVKTPRASKPAATPLPKKAVAKSKPTKPAKAAKAPAKQARKAPAPAKKVSAKKSPAKKTAAKTAAAAAPEAATSSAS